jgi:hypothetical protein
LLRVRIRVTLKPNTLENFLVFHAAFPHSFENRLFNWLVSGLGDSWLVNYLGLNYGGIEYIHLTESQYNVNLILHPNIPYTIDEINIMHTLCVIAKLYCEYGCEHLLEFGE